MKFGHMGDCHLGGWRQPELNALNFQSFKFALDSCIKEKVDFLLITGDLFDSAYPSIETLKESFNEFRRVKEAGIPVFLIAGSHDYSVSGKTFLDVLTNAGFCKNVSVFEEHNGAIMLLPTIYENVALYGYPGKKSGLEVDEISRMKIQDSPGLYKILLLHTTIRDAIGSLPIKAVDHEKLPKVDYLALSHLHLKYNKENRVYSGPTFPNNLSELEDVSEGSFYIVENNVPRRVPIKTKEVLSLKFEVKNTLLATEDILKKIRSQDLQDKIVIAKVYGSIEMGKTADIDFSKIETEVRKLGAFSFLKSTNQLHLTEPDIQLEVLDSENLESEIIENFKGKNPNPLNSRIPELMRVLQAEKLDDERSSVFEDRVITETRKVIILQNENRKDKDR
jgi:DNA repair protein SbcD/Mre11